MNHIFRGLSVAVVTPFKSDYSIDKEAYRVHLKRLIDGGVDNLVICGTTGESPTFSDDEFLYLIKEAVAIADGKTRVIAGSGSNDTKKTILRSQMAEEAGANGLLLVAPYYNKPGQKALIAHFAAVAESVTLPIILYNVPGRTAVNILPETTLALSQQPNIMAIKEASNDMQQILRVLELVPDDFAVLSGDDAMTMPVIFSGGQGVVSVCGNQIPEMMKRYTDACLNGDIKSARDWHLKLQPLMNFNFVESNPAPVKASLAYLGYMENVLRLPLVPMSENNMPKMIQILTKLGIK